MKKLRTLLTAVAVMLAVSVIGQTVNEAGELYNTAVQNIKAKNYAGAIVSLEECIDLCDIVGGDADDVRMNAEKQIPAMYYKSAASLYKKKKYPEAIEGFKKTIEVCEKYDNTDYAKKSMKYIPALYNGMAGAMIKKDQFDEAKAYITSALEYDPNFFKAFYSKAIISQKSNDVDGLKENVAKVVELDKKGKTATKAKTMAQKYFINNGAKDIQASKPSAAIAKIKQSFAYGDQNPSAYYYLAVAYNANKEYNKAIENASKALQFEKETKRSKIYYEMGNSYLGLENKAKAIENYKLVTGSNAAAAKTQLKGLLAK